MFSEQSIKTKTGENRMKRHRTSQSVLRVLEMLILIVSSTLSTRTATAAPIAEGADKFLGNISTSGPPSNFLNYWNQVTLENNGKWINVEPNRDQMNWSSVTAAYTYCKQNGIPYKHHTFVWGNQYPSWMNNLSAAEQKAEVEELIKEFGQKFPETAFIDVVNEAREKAPSWKTALGGDGATGCDWIVWSFEMARKYCPKAKLLINEYYCEKGLDYVTKYLKIINVLKAKNLIDGIGIQTHDGETKEGYKTGVFKQCLDSLATAGLPLYSTEFDMAGNDEEQLNFYKNIFPIIWEHPAIKGVTLWGWTSSWLPARLGDGRLMVNGQERPALKWLREYVAEHKIITEAKNSHKKSVPTTSITVDATSQGSIRLHVAHAQTLSMRVLDPCGRVVLSSTQKHFTPGDHTIVPAKYAFGPGLYVVAIEGSQSHWSQKVFIGR
jgi:endo-1,4-beta-xylanase